MSVIKDKIEYYS